METTARFGDCDPAGLVYYPRFFEWFHDTFESTFAAIAGVPYNDVVMRDRVGFPAVNLAAEFKRPVRFGDRVQVEVFLSRLTERSATFEYRVRGESGLCATASVKVATMDMDGAGSAVFPEAIFRAFLPYVESDDELPNAARLRSGS
ncbi:MAG: acyl-CoA thioesterase [Deltaproteobacteria bacterium]|nr:acyl-CoA thioesterase [Deltaproteobacteria bacterium]